MTIENYEKIYRIKIYSMKKLYIDENITVNSGENAVNLLKINNDVHYFNSKELDVHKVTEDRCRLAQKFERKTWMENPYMNDDI